MKSPTLALIESIARMRRQTEEDPQRLEGLRRLQDLQLERLRFTYADFLFHPRYRMALEFFMHDLYGPHDFSQRDRDLQKVLGSWERVLPARAVAAVRCALELEALTQALDLAVLDACGHRPPALTTYADAYRKVGRMDDRQRQIWLIVSAGRALNELIELTWVGTALRMARAPARLAGVAALQEFLERGHRAFARMGNADDLLHAIEQRETKIMRRLFAGTSAPFDLPELRTEASSTREPRRS